MRPSQRIHPSRSGGSTSITRHPAAGSSLIISPASGCSPAITRGPCEQGAVGDQVDDGVGRAHRCLPRPAPGRAGVLGASRCSQDRHRPGRETGWARRRGVARRSASAEPTRLVALAVCHVPWTQRSKASSASMIVTAACQPAGQVPPEQGTLAAGSAPPAEEGCAGLPAEADRGEQDGAGGPAQGDGQL